jgi:hypothetical protein
VGTPFLKEKTPVQQHLLDLPEVLEQQAGYSLAVWPVSMHLSLFKPLKSEWLRQWPTLLETLEQKCHKNPRSATKLLVNWLMFFLRLNKLPWALVHNE